jgi:drug/metabolite transporter (DMT)-like permease
MKLLLSLLGIVLIVVAVMYFVMPADSLPSFFPGHEAGVMRTHSKHGILAGVLGLVLLGIGWFMGRR